jgi:hypothetical protein
MPHIDELLGVATVAAAGLLATILLQPASIGATERVAADAYGSAMIVEVVATRTPQPQPDGGRECVASVPESPET